MSTPTWLARYKTNNNKKQQQKTLLEVGYIANGKPDIDLLQSKGRNS